VFTVKGASGTKGIQSNVISPHLLCSLRINHKYFNLRLQML